MLEIAKGAVLVLPLLYKAVIGDTRCKSRMTKNKRLRTIIAEAYAHATLHNHYFVWLFKYKANHPESNLVTEYDNLTQGPLNDSKDQQGMLLTTLFCGDLDMVEVLVTREEIKMHLQGGSEMVDEEHKVAREHAESVTNDIRHCIDDDKVGSGDGSSRLAQYLKMVAKLEEDATQKPMMVDRKSTKKRRQESERTLSDFMKETRKTKKGSNTIKGWSVEGKQYMKEMVGKINQDKQSGICKKWEAMYQCSTIQQARLAWARRMMMRMMNHLRWMKLSCIREAENLFTSK